MIYSKENFNKLSYLFKKEKKKTYLITLAQLLVVALFVVLSFLVKHLSFVILGFIFSIIAFGYFFYRLDVTHKKLKNKVDFYADIVYSEKSTEEVEFLAMQGSTISNKREFNTIKVYKLKTESVVLYLVDKSHEVTMQQNKRYLLTLSNNILVDYKEVQNDF